MPRSLDSTTVGCNGTQQCRIYVRAQTLLVLYPMMFLLHWGQMSAYLLLMKFPLHGNQIVVLVEVVAHSPHVADEEDTPTGLEPDSGDPSNYHS
jgi:hypothetical protein